MTQAEKETIEAFCRELALALRRITGRNIDFPQVTLPVEVKDPGHVSGQTDKTDVEEPEDKQ
jgi:hypothetical protein